MPFVNDDQRKAAFARMKGSGSNKPKTRRPKQPGQSLQRGYDQQFAVGYAGNYTQGAPNWSNWYNNFPNVQQMPAEVFSGTAPSGAFEIFNGLTPEQFYDQQWNQHSGLDFWIWSINLVLAEGIDPASGQIQAPLGTPGQLTLSSMLMLTLATDMTDMNATEYGGQDASMPTQYWGTAAEGNPAAAQNYAGIYAAYLQHTGQSTRFLNSYQQYLQSIGQAP